MYEIGAGKGKYFSLNVPLKDGIDDEGRAERDTLDTYKPDAGLVQQRAPLTKSQLSLFSSTLTSQARKPM